MDVATSNFLKRLNLGAMPLRDAVKCAVDLYRADPLFSVLYPSKCIRDDAKVVILGTTDFSRAFINASGGRVPILGVVDDFKAGKGETFEGLEIITTTKLLRLARSTTGLLCVNACRYDRAKRYFMEWTRHNGIPLVHYEQAVRLFAWHPARDHRLEDWAPVIAERFEDFMALANRLNDDYSRETLYAVLLFHLTCEAEWYLNIMRPYIALYFRSGLFYLSSEEKLVDCGASVGESTSALIGITQGKFAHSWMVEPDRFNVETLQKLTEGYENTPIHSKLTILPVAVGETSMRASFNHMGGHGGTVDLNGAGGEVAIERVDDLIDDAPTMIKMDVEGFEMSALRGARNTILTAKPRLAISAYHRATDLLEIPIYVDSLGVEYKIGLRHHTADRWDTCLYFYR